MSIFRISFRYQLATDPNSQGFDVVDITAPTWEQARADARQFLKKVTRNSTIRREQRPEITKVDELIWDNKWGWDLLTRWTM